MSWQRTVRVAGSRASGRTSAGRRYEMKAKVSRQNVWKEGNRTGERGMAKKKIKIKNVQNSTKAATSEQPPFRWFCAHTRSVLALLRSQHASARLPPLLGIVYRSAAISTTRPHQRLTFDSWCWPFDSATNWKQQQQQQQPQSGILSLLTHFRSFALSVWLALTPRGTGSAVRLRFRCLSLGVHSRKRSVFIAETFAWRIH